MKNSIDSGQARMTMGGFTLMELLIVIGVLGILAAGLLAAIDPFEQLKKARDANNRNASVELLNGFTRYYASHGEFPWNLPGVNANCDSAAGDTVPGSISGGVVELQDIDACVDSIEADGELKVDFNDNVKTDIYVSSEDDTDIAVCFAPEGKALRNDTLTKWLFDGTSTITEDDGTNCPDSDNENCLQCFR